MKNTETTILEVQLNDGSSFRVICANKSQFNRAHKAGLKMGARFRPITNGLHTIAQFEKIVASR
jgi:hypothetical protein